LREHFNGIAEEYEAQIPEHVRSHFLDKKISKIDEVLSKSNLKNATGLDLGCGLGWYTQSMYEKGYNVIGVDYSKDYIKKAKHNSKSRHLHFIMGDARRLPFKDARFGFVFSINVFHHNSTESQEIAFSEVARVLIPKGIFFLHEINIINPLFRFYVNYIFPRIRTIDTGGEEWIIPNDLYEITDFKVLGITWFSFLPDFFPNTISLPIKKVESILEMTAFARYGIHYMAVLKKIGSD